MVTNIDEKGKIFTNIIAKSPLPATIQTDSHRIHGEIYVRPNERVKDELNRSEAFLAVTNATVFGPQGEILYRSNFLTLNLQHVIWLIPDDELCEE